MVKGASHAIAEIAETGMPAGPQLALERFVPYRLSVLMNLISGALAGAYAERYGLSVPEWRTMAVLGRFSGLSAAEVAERSAMDKVQVSRAVARMLGNGLLKRRTHGADRRRSVLELSAKGLSIYARIVPLARRYEADFLACLTPAERDQFDRLLTKLTEQARVVEPPPD